MPDVVDPALARAFLQRLHAAANAHDAEAVAAQCTDDVVWEDPAAPHTLHGRAEVLGFHRDIMFPALPDTRIELIAGPYVAADGLGIAARVRISGTMTGPLTPPGLAPTGGHLSFETAEFSQFRGGLLAHHTVILNMLDLARQIGAVPQPGTVADRLGVWMQHVAAFWSRSRRDPAAARTRA
jgi:predicted ester cyclase